MNKITAFRKKPKEKSFGFLFAVFANFVLMQSLFIVVGDFRFRYLEMNNTNQKQ
jgi:hypothetical protein